MKVKNTISLTAALSNYMSDDLALYLFNSELQTNIATIEPETMDVVNSFSVEAPLHSFYQPCIDDSCLYFPTTWGQILILDKLSGGILESANTKLPIMSHLKQDEQNIYCICGVPISMKLGLATERYCVCIHNKESGAKRLQTSYFSGEPVFLGVVEDDIWVVAGAYLIVYDKDGQQRGEVSISLPPDYEPIFTNEFVICPYKNGMIRVIRRDSLKHYKVLKGPKNISGPLQRGNLLFWMSEDGACCFDYLKQAFKVLKSNRSLSSFIAVSEEGTKSFGCSEGNLVKFDWEERQVMDVKLARKFVQPPLIFERYLFVPSETQLHQIEI